ncbi:MAG: HU family DNA-binding protein [bacterium]|nr:HU family DNA-binding protein [bacterium]
MNKRDLAYIVAYETGMSRALAEAGVDSVFKAISAALQDGAKVRISGFGTFEVRDRKARVGRNPRTGETVPIPATRAPAFRAAQALKQAVNS